MVISLRSLSIKGKLIVISMATSCLALLLASLSFAVFDIISVRTMMVTEARTLTEIIGTNSNAALTFNHAQAAEEILSGLGQGTYRDRGHI